MGPATKTCSADRGPGLTLVFMALSLVVAGCRVGGTPAESLQESVALPYIEAPEITFPSKSPFYSKDGVLEMRGVCKPLTTVYLMGSQIDAKVCRDSEFSFTLTQGNDGVYSYLVSQGAASGATSTANFFLWVRKNSVSLPVLTSPSRSPYLSSQSVLQLSGSCESGAEIAISGDTSQTTTCSNSRFNADIYKANDGDYNFTITQTDPAGNSAAVPLQWQRRALTVSPLNPTLVVNSPQVFTISGGSGTYSMTLLSNNSGATLNGGTNTYTAGRLAGVKDRLRIVDSQGAAIEIDIETVAGLPDHFALPDDSGNAQSVRVGAVLPTPFKVKVVDEFGNGIPSYPVRFRVLGGDGRLLAPNLQTTDSSGIASMPFRVGYQSILNSVAVVPASGVLPDLALSGLATLTLNATMVSDGRGTLGAAFPVGTNPGTIVTGDVTGDGRTDVLVLNSGDPSVSVFSGQVGGMLKALPSVTNLCVGPNHILLRDFDKDAQPDLVVACPGSDSVVFLRGLGNGSFAAPVAIPFDPGESLPTSMAAADFNGDGNLDLAVTSAGLPVLGVRFGDGTGSFAAPQLYAVGATASAVEAGDVNKDGHLDLTVVNAGDSTISLLMNNGNGTFALQALNVAGAAPVAISMGDFNEDGYADAVVVNSAENTLSVFLSDRISAYEPPLTVNTGANPTSVVVKDLNGDSHLDLAVTQNGESSMALFLGRGDASFDIGPVISLQPGPVFVTSVDLNLDSIPDLVVSSNGSQRVEVVPGQVGGRFGFSSEAGASPVATVVLDIDNDGILDQAVLNGGDNSVSLLRGLGTGLFVAAGSLVTRPSPTAISAADVNHDGLVDLLVTAGIGNALRVYLNKGDGGFNALDDVGVGASPQAIASGDFNNDGHLDLLVASGENVSVGFLPGLGDGTFGSRLDVSVGSYPVDVVRGDFNGDLNLDFACLNRSDSTVSIVLGNGDGTFRPQFTYAVGISPSALVAGHFNTDGQLDLAVANEGEDSISILLGRQNGSFFEAVSYSAGGSPKDLVTGDFNGDGRQDLAVATGVNNLIVWLPGASSGQFNVTNTVDSAFAPIHLTVGDFNGDGISDFSVLSQVDSMVRVLMGN